MLKDGSDKREADIDRLVSRLADALTPKISRHIKKYGLPGTTRRLIFNPAQGKHFFTTPICTICGLGRDEHSHQDIKRCYVKKNHHSSYAKRKTEAWSTEELNYFINSGGLALSACDHKLTLYNGSVWYRRRKGNPKNLKVPLAEILQRLTSMYRKSGFILDMTICKTLQPAPAQEGRERHWNPTFDIKLQPIQASDKPSEP